MRVRKEKKKKVCLNCGREFTPLHSSFGKYCCNKCQSDYEYRTYIQRWKKGEENGIKSGIDVSNYVRRYLFEKNDNKCQICGWGKINEFTNKIPLQIHHIDGNALNNKEENLQLLCPCCHSLTENFGRRNKNATLGRSKYFGKDTRKKVP